MAPNSLDSGLANSGQEGVRLFSSPLGWVSPLGREAGLRAMTYDHATTPPPGVGAWARSQ